MKNSVLIIAVVAIATVAGGGGAYYYLHNVSRAMDTSSQCNDPDSISSHVYNSYRLDILNSCIQASGTVENVFEEADGDYHLGLALDPQYANLTNRANDKHYYGNLVVEIICALPITQQDAVSACQGYTNSIKTPSVNDHITVTGPYVLDTEHYNWAEIHPVYTLTIS